MMVTSRIYAQLENSETIYHIASIEYTSAQFGDITLIDEGVKMVAESILDLLRQVEDIKRQQLHRAAHGEDPDSDTSTGHVQQ